MEDRLGPLTHVATVELETADRRIVSAEVCGPVRIQLAGFRTIVGEAVFVKMRPGRKGYEPLVGYTVLELAGAVVDMVSHRLIARKYYDLKAAAARSTEVLGGRGGVTARRGRQGEA